jgi:hypothetical protein
MHSFSPVHLDALAFLYDNLAEFPAWIRRLTPGQMADLAAIVSRWHARRAEMEDVVPLDWIEKQEVTRAIAKFNGDVCAAAKALGMGKTTIYRRLKKWGCSGESWQRMSQAAALAHKPRVVFQVPRGNGSSLHGVGSLPRTHGHNPDTERRHQ